MPCLFARGQPSSLLVTHPVWLQMGHCQAMFVGEGDWFFAFNSQDAGVYSRFADINVPAIYVCVCVLRIACCVVCYYTTIQYWYICVHMYIYIYIL